MEGGGEVVGIPPTSIASGSLKGKVTDKDIALKKYNIF